MILVVGSSADRVFPKLLEALRACGRPFAVLDEDYPGRYMVNSSGSNGAAEFRVSGGECGGHREVGAIFVRHAVARTLEPEHLAQLGRIQTALNRLLWFASCPVVNLPAHAYSNYSKPYQLRLLAQAGFDVPNTLLTNNAGAARRFYDANPGGVIVKGVSNVMTFARLLSPDLLPRLKFLPNSPTLFQEYVAGVDYRVHVIGESAFVTRLIARNEDYRKSALQNQDDIHAESAQLPAAVLARCISFTRQLGLVVGGLDFKETPSGRLVALELNPYPQFTFYEGRSGQPLTKAVVQYLIEHQTTQTNVFA